MRLPIAPEGHREVVLAGIAAVGLGLAGAIWYRPLMVVAGVGWLAVIFFFRNPRRTAPQEPGVMVAPADGWIRQIARDEYHPLVGGPALRVQIFLSVLDVHVNRSPCRGKVREVRYQPGRFLNAMREESGKVNEANAVVMQTEQAAGLPVVVRQIAGVIARRIVCNVRQGEHLETGQRIGMIKFGSRTELLVPAAPNWQVTVRVGQHVRAGQTIIMRWLDEPASPPGGDQPRN